MIWRAQNSFSGGIISEKMFGRVDLPQYMNSVAMLENFKVLPHGGLKNRSGTKFAHEVKDSAKVTRLIEFEFSQDESYCLEFGDLYIRFYENGSLIESGGSPVELVTPFTAAEVFNLDYIQTGDVITLFHKDFEPRRIVRVDDTGTNWAIENTVLLDGPYLPINTDKTLTLVSSVATGTVNVTASAAFFVSTDVGRQIRIYDTGTSEWGWGEITSITSATVAIVDIAEGVYPTVATDQWRLGKFSDTTGWPETGMYYEQRLAMAGAEEHPQDVDFSQTALFENFGTSRDATLKDSDGVGIVFYSPKVDNIQWLLPTRYGLAVGTSGGCWILTGSGGKDDPITPSSINVRKTVATTSHSIVAPQQLGNAILFVDKTGRRVHELAYSWQDDNHKAPDMTLLAEDLFTGRSIVDTASSADQRIFWCVLSDGTLLGMTYMRDEGVLAWHKHTTDGQFESVAVVSEGSKDTLYCVVKRTINGSVVRYVEYLEQDFDSTELKDAYFVDCGIVSTGQTITGLNHLEGKGVVALADGKVIAEKTVVSGQIVLPSSATLVHVGLPIVAQGETLPLEIANMKSGSTLGRVKNIGEVMVLVTNSYGMRIGRDGSNMAEVPFNAEIVHSTAPELFSGSKVIDSIGGQPARDARIRFSQSAPLPLTINSITALVDILED